MADGFEQLSLFGGRAGSRSRAARDEPPPALPEDRHGESQGGGAPASRTGHPAAAGLHPDLAGGPFAGFTDLEALAALAVDCRRCGLREGCQGVVFGEGSPQARIMLVGEGPGANEDRLGRPFVGRAGQLLDRILAAIGLVREEVYITNVVKCRPPGNRTPTEAELRTCLPYLLAQVRLIRPDIIVCMGSTAVRALIDPDARITRVRGTWVRRWGVDVMPTFHPAAVLRDPSKRRPVWEDFKAIRRRYDELLAAGGADPGEGPAS